MQFEVARLRVIPTSDVSKVPRLNEIIPARLDKVIDGDTLLVIILLDSHALKISVRVKGIDAPETKLSKTTTALQKEAGKKVGKYVSGLFKDDIVYIKLACLDKYGGRYVGDVYMSVECSCTLTDHLVGLGCVKAYDGKKKTEWTTEELTKIIGMLH